MRGQRGGRAPWFNNSKNDNTPSEAEREKKDTYVCVGVWVRINKSQQRGKMYTQNPNESNAFQYGAAFCLSSPTEKRIDKPMKFELSQYDCSNNFLKPADSFSIKMAKSN